MVSPWMEHGSVMEAIRNHPEIDRYLLCQQLANVIQYLHRMDVVHGDIKGDNLLMAPDGTPKLTDFGLAIMHDAALKFSKTTNPFGTLRWMAPELIQGGERCYETDVYAMGMTFLEIVTGEIPFSTLEKDLSVSHAVVYEKQTPDVAFLAKDPVSPRSNLMIGILHRCWRYNPQERATADEIVGLVGNIGSV
ncbi:hypothetical protein FRC07_003574 [Ceratobasidium sp. 392]|nr:hypothetical protein FRC07_003574 [Ceratobasidium sp. 392]